MVKKAQYETRIIRVDPRDPDALQLQPAAEALRQGELVAFPTETVYGLGANALDPAAVAKIYQAKGRPSDNPLIVHLANLTDLQPLVREIPPLARLLYEAFAPGPITLIMPKSDAVPAAVTAGLDTVAIRFPAHPVARKLIELAGVPVAAPSANRSGRPSPTKAWHVEADLAGRIPYIIEAGSCQFGLESTVVDVTGEIPVILRPGAITAAAIREIAGAVAGAGAGDGDEKVPNLPHLRDPSAAPRSPGMKYRHYAPKATVLIADNPDPEARFRQLGNLAEDMIRQGKPAGIFSCRQCRDFLSGEINEISLDFEHSQSWNDQLTSFPPNQLVCIFYGSQPDAQLASAALFDALRSLDQSGVEVIIAEGLPEKGMGSAYMNRLRKAASGGPRPETGNG